jgi:hypothetical protein
MHHAHGIEAPLIQWLPSTSRTFLGYYVSPEKSIELTYGQIDHTWKELESTS